MAFAGRIIGTVAMVGVGLVAVAVIASPGLLRAARPTVREALKRGIGLYEQARQTISELAEDLEDLVAEVRADMTATQPAAEGKTGDPGLNGAGAKQAHPERQH